MPASTAETSDNQPVRWVDWHVYDSDQHRMNPRLLRFKQVSWVAARYDVSRNRAANMIDYGDIEPPTEEQL